MGMSDRIKEKRIENGYTQEELAEKLGLQKSAIAKYENGRVENMKRSVIEKMSEILMCSPAYLMGWDEEEKDNAYYLDPDAAQIAQEVFERPQMKVLFDASRKVSAEDLDLVINMLDRMKKAETHEDEE